MRGSVIPARLPYRAGSPGVSPGPVTTRGSLMESAGVLTPEIAGSHPALAAHSPVAQRNQSIGLLIRRAWVRIPPGPLVSRIDTWYTARMFKWLTHRKEWVLHKNGGRLCACGHSSNEHLPGLYCGMPSCHCYNATYFYNWVRK